VIVPGGFDNLEQVEQAGLTDWLASAGKAKQIASVCTGALLLAAAGLLKGKTAATHPTAREELSKLGVIVSVERLVRDGNTYSAGGVTSGIDLGLALCKELAGKDAAESIRRQMDYPHAIQSFFVVGEELAEKGRKASLSRRTNETNIQVAINLDGTGKHEIQSGIPFLDHMLTQVAVHGRFDLRLNAVGDLEIDPHHTAEDIAICLGQVFNQALGDKKGIVRSASAFFTMDESLAWVGIDLSGRPYSVIQAEWHTPTAGNLPTSLISHFLESFATHARCNLHARVIYGQDDHHQAEALFKALGRALDTAVRFDPRIADVVPSTKGVLE
jgi:imidazoleglycerol-phosphate dehydratase